MSKKTLKTIVESGNDYVIQVKGNCKSLLNKLKKIIREFDYIDVEYTKEKNRGRIETRQCSVFEIPHIINEYESCKTLVHIINSGQRNGIDYKEDHYYISNKSREDAAYFLKGIRGHWSIENSCHWVKDAIMNEDKSRVNGMALGENLSIIRNMVMNIYRLNNQPSIKKAIEKYCNRIKESIELVKQLHIEKI